MLAAGLSGPGSGGLMPTVERLVGLHSSDPAAVYLALRARIAGFTVDDLETDLYDTRRLLRVLGMRRTVFVVPTRLAGTVHNSSTAALISGEKRRTWRMVEEGGIAEDGRAWVERVAERTLEAISSTGPSTALELRHMVPELKETLTVHKADGSVAGTIGISTRILFLLATEARIVRGRPRGTWLSSQYEWAAYQDWVGAEMDSASPEQARKDLIRRWLNGFGPGTETDIKWWTGWPVGKVRIALDSVGARVVETSSGPAYVLPEFDPPVATEGAVAFLPGLDPSIMGWKQRDWYLGEHAHVLFDRNGNAGPTIVLDGLVVGGWGQRTDGEVVYEVLEDVGRDAHDSIDRAASELREWLGEFVVTPRFRTPLERKLATPG